MKQIKKELVEKYEKMSFLEGIPNEDKEELSQLYEDFTNFVDLYKTNQAKYGNMLLRLRDRFMKLL